jgi:serpin B
MEQAASEELAKLAWDLYLQQDARAANFVYSPYSIAAALAMLSAGAAGATLSELKSALRFNDSGELLHARQNALAQLLASRNRAAAAQRGAQVLRVSNDLWMLPSLQPTSGFLDVIARYYGASVHLAPFEREPEASRAAINAKVSRDTNALIPELLPKGSIDSSARFVLTNALYFKAPWATPFRKVATMPRVFTALDGARLRVPMMSQQATLRYAAGEGFVAVALPYAQEQLQMVFLLPELGTFPAFVRRLDAQVVESIVATLAPTYVAISLPRFEVTAALPLKDELMESGMRAAFDPAAAEFPGIAKGIFITGAFHQARLIVDEDGTEAAAATALIGSTSSAPPRPVFVRDGSGAVLFLGHLVRPQ